MKNHERGKWGLEVHTERIDKDRPERADERMNFKLDHEVDEHPEYSEPLRKLREDLSEVDSEKREVERLLRKIEARAAVLRKRENAILEIPALFDDANGFVDLAQGFTTLRDAGVIKLTIGGKEYAIKNLAKLVERISNDIQARQFEDGEIDVYLAEMGVTRGKIHESSARGLRQLLQHCIEDDIRARADIRKE